MSSIPVRRLTARSAVLSVLLGAHPPQAPANAIVRLAGELGVQETTVRAALTRMVAAGDLERTGSTYRLAPRLLARQERQDRALDPELVPWDGQWRLIVITGSGEAADRAALRDSLQTAKFGEIREGVWARPDNLVRAARDIDHPRLTYFTAHPDLPDELAHRLFRPDVWADDARMLLDAHSRATSLRDRLEIAAAMVRHILRDPILPDLYLPQPWPGTEIRAAYREFRASYTEHAKQHLGVD